MGEATVEEAETLKEILHEYGQATRQNINEVKSSILFAKDTPNQIKHNVKKVLNMKEMTGSEMHLRLPSLWGRSKIKTLSFLKERIIHKIQGWKQRLLSQAGRKTLNKAVLAVIPTYTMALFKLPTSFCRQISSLMAIFWWGGDNKEYKVHWKSWNCLMQPKEIGGMGFKDIEDFNRANLAKQSWKLINEGDRLWAKIIKGLYFPHTSFWNAKKAAGRKSWLCQSLLIGREVLKEEESRSKLQMICNDEEIKAIMQIPVARYPRNDRLVWHHTKDGKCSIKSGYKAIKLRQANRQVEDHQFGEKIEENYGE
ncbi:conserved hypothetical protein [Ricinus communis]|uniref:Reverse transcriptase n=1 Tax=Ricinus communis TaxID=3988 RepID=B9RQW8_RICCO|nr:conserved hypothetical protein [Ricinus communis]